MLLLCVEEMLLKLSNLALIDKFRKYLYNRSKFDKKNKKKYYSLFLLQWLLKIRTIGELLQLARERFKERKPTLKVRFSRSLKR